MYVQVKLLKGYSEPLLYRVPTTWEPQDLVGSIVHVSIRNAVAHAIVIEQLPQLPPNTTFAIKELLALDAFPADPHYHTFIQNLSIYYQVSPTSFINRVRQFLSQQKTEVVDDPESALQLTHNADPSTTFRVPGLLYSSAHAITLTDEQQKVCDFLTPYLHTPAYTPTLMHGVTGSGKTEVYKRLITHAIAAGKSVILSLPEVTLALQFQKILQQQLPEINMYGFHSAAGTKEKRALWQRLLDRKPTLIIGVHLPALLPIANLGLIIMDEEHEAGYQEKKHPKINSKDAAIWRAQMAKIPILLGSATPSLSSLHNVKTKNWHFFQLTKRFAGTLPTIETVLLTDKKQRKSFWISQKLQDAIKDRLQKKEQVIIFLNRRGFSFFVQCKACTFVFECAHCSVSLTLHADSMLACHYCGFTRQVPHSCPQCKADEREFLKKGIGTQQIVTILERLFPSARIGRADLDITTKKTLWQKTLGDFQSGELDILVGTQTITKGFHFPKVTLVGIVWADVNLNFPIFNASETVLQQLIQVAGRAGRESTASTVIVQAMADHPIFNYLNEVDYLQFYNQEMLARAELRYPPCARLAEIELKHTNEVVLEREAHALAVALFTRANTLSDPITVLGPAKPPINKIKNTHMRKIYLKGDSINAMINMFQAIEHDNYASKIYFTPSPTS